MENTDVKSTEEIVGSENNHWSGDTQLEDPSGYEDFIVSAIYKNFDGYTKTNFVADADKVDNNVLNIANYQLKDMFFAAKKFENFELAKKIAHGYFQYYGIESQKYAIYGLNEGQNPKMIWYQDGYFEYRDQAKKAHDKGWFYKVLNFQKLYETFNHHDAPINMSAKDDNNALLVNNLGFYPRNLLIVSYNDQGKFSLYMLDKKTAYDSYVSRFARLYSQLVQHKYEDNQVKVLSKRLDSFLSQISESFSYNGDTLNESDVPSWVRSLARYGRN